MAKILQVKRSGDERPYYELVATSPNDLSNGHWTFKSKPFRYVLAPSNQMLAQRWLAIMEENLPLWTSHPLIGEMIKYLMKTQEKLAGEEYILYTGDRENLPPNVTAFEHPKYGLMIISNVRKIARQDIRKMERAMKQGEPVSFYNSTAIHRMLANRAQDVLRRSPALREGLYLDPNDITLDAMLHDIKIDVGPIVPEEVFFDEQDIKRRYFGYLLETHEGTTERRTMPNISYGDTIPSEHVLGSIISTDISNIQRALGQDPFFDTPFFMLVKEFRDYIVDEYNRRAEAEGLPPMYA